MGSRDQVASDHAEGTQSTMEFGIGLVSWITCSVGMLIFNKMAISAFPVACSLVAFQFFATVIAMMVFCFKSLHIGSITDVMRWSLVAPFFTGMILSSILALENAPMTLVITFRAISPVISLIVERFYPNPLKVTWQMLLAMATMLGGVGFYCTGIKAGSSTTAGVCWAIANNFLAIGDRLLQRLFLSKDQSPVDISKTGCTLLNNLLGMFPLLIAAWATNEFEKIPGAMSEVDALGAFWIAASCAVGVGISYTGIWVQSLISATSFLVLVNANKFAIIFLEAYALPHWCLQKPGHHGISSHEGESTSGCPDGIFKGKDLSNMQILGAVISIVGGILYGKARELAEQQKEDEQSEEESSVASGSASD